MILSLRNVLTKWIEKVEIYQGSALRAACSMFYCFYQDLLRIISSVHSSPFINFLRSLCAWSTCLCHLLTKFLAQYVIRDFITRASFCIWSWINASSGEISQLLKKLNTCFFMIIISVYSLPLALVLLTIVLLVSSCVYRWRWVLCHFHRGSCWPLRRRKYTTYNAKIASNPVGSMRFCSTGQRY